jgi:glyoxylase-like metal-dependent hydrolase (beta-lactamase superfamily II)
MTEAVITWLDADTVQIRQPKSSHWEAPFLYLLFGRERAILLDTGATGDEAVFPPRRTVDDLTSRWLQGRTGAYPLVVAHTHAHGDHIAGDVLFEDRAATTVVGTGVSEVVEFFGFRSWPDETVDFDLGDRVLKVIGAPGHEVSAVVFFDPGTGILFTGDTVCPGHLYVRDDEAFRQTIDRLLEFATGADVRELRGAHIEMTSRPGVVYEPGTVDQPDEAELALPPGILEEVRAALDEPGPRVVRDRFIVVREGQTA